MGENDETGRIGDQEVKRINCSTIPRIKFVCRYSYFLTSGHLITKTYELSRLGYLTLDYSLNLISFTIN
jgi:hypothetical protein